MILSIIIPTFNEEKTIREILLKVKEVKLPKNLKKEIIVVDDCSSDKTSSILKGIKFPFRYIRHSRNLGKGASIRTGLKVATGDYVIIQDADLEYDPGDYSKLLQPVMQEKAQVVYGTRLINYPLKLWGRTKTVMPLHLIANHLLTKLTNILYGGYLTDMETGYKLLKKEVLQQITLKSDRFDIEPEITAKILKKNIPIIEIPIKSNPRTYREGKKISWRDGLIAIWALIKYRIVD